ncbi:Uncharacterized oxidoreductase [Seminavis robusta]|uniref:Uncharacterized oxidoreductase n=1 Tax=Seminavis robusta TaxID=568900 RepID=A0A9N8D7D2_9STRA|nr:Uncharacterized oxidoreductase [Seminavis robusta]|eukprot:Sro6_g005070.1 Uncharacterized oxidoreductase (350) ;mRNA; f:91732-92781
MTDTTPPLRVALLGAGLFATNSHAPVLIKFKDVFDTKAVWSRTKESAEKLAPKLGCEALGGETELDSLMARQDIDAFVVALPLDVQPALVLRLLKAGKHVLSEKPIAPTVELAQQLVAEYQAIPEQQRQWSVAENFRYEPGIETVAEKIRTNEIGDILLLSLVVKNPFRHDNPYLNTAWRKEPSWYGGLFVDAFIHAAAAIRTMIPGELRQVSAVTSHRADHLPGPDTMAGHVQWENGVQGTITASYASDTFHYAFEVTGRQGTIVLQRSTKQPGYDLIVTKGMGKDTAVTTEFFKFQGLDKEFLAFAAACRKQGDDKNTPQQALQDLKLVQALLESGKQGGAVVKVQT